MSRTQLERVRRVCLDLPGTFEKLSHGEPTFFVGKKVFVMFANDHHGDGRIAVWIPVPPGAQASLIASDPETCFRPPYVGVRGWVGVALVRIEDGVLSRHIETAWS
ncbi:MAG: MmcQ/YjbR family DNA-binding protein [Candidatus Eisenbacteria bacterium]|nr:MmcQ/YjbR family DNA-binding protein [Candidatus Eisenbacteria bacterium]